MGRKRDWLRKHDPRGDADVGQLVDRAAKAGLKLGKRWILRARARATHEGAGAALPALATRKASAMAATPGASAAAPAGTEGARAMLRRLIAREGMPHARRLLDEAYAELSAAGNAS